MSPGGIPRIHSWEDVNGMPRPRDPNPAERGGVTLAAGMALGCCFPPDET